MTPEECLQVYDQLVLMLRQKEMVWIIQQVNETLLLGKPQSKKVKTFKERPSNDQLPLVYNADPNLSAASENKARLTGPEVDLTATLEYTPQERLTLLISAIEQAVVETAEMEQITLRNLETISKNQHVTDIVFVSEQDGQAQLSLSKEAAVLRSDTARQLRQLLQQLKETIYAH